MLSHSKSTVTKVWVLGSFLFHPEPPTATHSALKPLSQISTIQHLDTPRKIKYPKEANQTSDSDSPGNEGIHHLSLLNWMSPKIGYNYNPKIFKKKLWNLTINPYHPISSTNHQISGGNFGEIPSFSHHRSHHFGTKGTRWTSSSISARRRAASASPNWIWRLKWLKFTVIQQAFGFNTTWNTLWFFYVSLTFG